VRRYEVRQGPYASIWAVSRETPSLRILERSVVRLSPSLAAAPFSPPTTQRASPLRSGEVRWGLGLPAEVTRSDGSHHGLAQSQAVPLFPEQV
jgi:hypothetical protein